MLLKNTRFAHSKVNGRFAVDSTNSKTFLALGTKGCNKHLPEVSHNLFCMQQSAPVLKINAEK